MVNVTHDASKTNQTKGSGPSQKCLEKTYPNNSQNVTEEPTKHQTNVEKRKLDYNKSATENSEGN